MYYEFMKRFYIMKLNKFTVVLAILLVSILAIGAVSAESVDDAGIGAVADGDIQGSVEVTDTADDLSTANTADETVGDDSSGPDDTVDYDLDDDTYSTYFNEDGTATDALSADGNYYLNVGTLTNKDIKIVSGQNVYIQGKEGAGIIKNGTITIGNGADKIESVQISGITFVNNNKDGICINPYSENIAIARNNFDLTYDASYGALDYASPMAIVSYGYVNGITIVGNNISMKSAAMYTYGIDLTIYTPHWGPQAEANPNDIYIADNDIFIDSSSAYGMGEGMYLDSLTNAVIENNNIYVHTVGDAANYGMQLSDSCAFNYVDDEYEGAAISPFNVTIKDNTVVLDSNDMAYGITAISAGPFDTDYQQYVRDIVISGNDVTVTSAKGAIGIGTSSFDAAIVDNKITVSADASAVNNAYADNYFGNESSAVYVNNYNDVNGYFYNNTVTDNVIVSNVPAIRINKTEGIPGYPVEPLVIENNEIQNSIFIDDESFATYFNADGTIKDDAPITAGDVLLLGDLTNKKLVIDTGLIIRGVPNKKLVNSTVNLVQGADNSVIEDLDMEFTGDNTTGSIGIIYIINVNNVTIQNNIIEVPDFVDKPGSKYGSSVYAIEVESGMLGCNDIFINNNFITMEGSCRNLYGIDVFANSYYSQPRLTNVNIFENYINIKGGSRMAEGIYVSACDDVIIDGNTIDSTSNGAAYGIATDQNTNTVIASNTISADAATQAYGIVATTSGSDTIIRANEIDAKGTGAVGIGINYQDGVIIEDNTVAIDGGDYTSLTPGDSLGNANAAILVGDGNTNVEMNNNDVTETSTVRLDTVIEVSDLTVTAAPSGEGKLQITLKTAGGMALANQTVKVVFDSKMYELTTDAKGVATFSFPLSKGGTYNVEVFYLGDDDYRGADASAKITINKVKTSITASGKTFLATAKTKKLTAILKDANGKAIAGKKVTFTVNGKTYTATTNANGVATVKLALKAAKTYKVSIKFAGDGVYVASTKTVKVKLNKEKTKLTAPKKTFKRTAKTKKVVVTLKNSKGKAIAKKKVTLIVNKKKYTVKTNKKGKATFKVKLTKKGTFKYTAKFAGDTQYKAVKKSAKIKIK